MANRFSVNQLLLTKQTVTATGDNLYVNGLLVGSGVFYPSFNPSGYITGFDSGQYATNVSLNLTGQDLLSRLGVLSGQQISLSGDLAATGNTLNSRLLQSGQDLFSRIGINSGNLLATGDSLNSRLIASGSDLFLRLDSLSGRQLSLSGDLLSSDSDLLFRITTLSGQVVNVTGSQSISGSKDFLSGLLISGRQALTGIIGGTNITVQDNGNGSFIINSVDGSSVGGVTGIRTTGLVISGDINLIGLDGVNIAISGNIIEFIGNTPLITSLSGDLITSGNNLWNRDVSLSGDLAATGNSLNSRLNNTGIGIISLSGDVRTTGNSLNSRLNSTGMEIISLSGDLTATGNSLNGRLLDSGYDLLSRNQTLSGQVVNITGTQSISGEKDFLSGLLVSGRQVLTGIEAGTNITVQDNGNGSFVINSTASGPGGGGGGVSGIGTTGLYISGNVDFTGINGATVSISGNVVVIQASSSTYLSGNIENAVYTSGSQIISGEKVFQTGVFISGSLLVGSGIGGVATTAQGFMSFSQGQSTKSNGNFSHAQGQLSTANGNFSHAEGAATSNGTISHAEGSSTTDSSALASHAEGLTTKTWGQYSHSEGSNTNAYGVASHAEGISTSSSGDYSHTEGYGTSTHPGAYYSHAEGILSYGYGTYSHAEGQQTISYGNVSHAEGYKTISSGYYSHAEGSGSRTFQDILSDSGHYSHAEGINCISIGIGSHSEGFNTISDRPYSHAQGSYNRTGVSGLFQVGRGTGDAEFRKDIIYISDSEINPSILSGRWNIETGVLIENKRLLTGLTSGASITLQNNNDGTFTVGVDGSSFVSQGSITSLSGDLITSGQNLWNRDYPVRVINTGFGIHLLSNTHNKYLINFTGTGNSALGLPSVSTLNSPYMFGISNSGISGRIVITGENPILDGNGSYRNKLLLPNESMLFVKESTSWIVQANSLSRESIYVPQKPQGVASNNMLSDTWTIRAASNQKNWSCICWSPELGIFVVLSYDASNNVMTSPDGITWTSRSAAQANSWQSVCWSPELRLFVAVSSDGTNRVMTSPDGITWTSRSAAQANSWQSVCWSPELGLFVAVGYGDDVMTSRDGITWTGSFVVNSFWQSVCWSPELRLFVAITTSGGAMTSPDGITWTTHSVAEANSWQSVCWSPELRLFVAVSSDGTNRVMTSPDGITWTSRSAAQANSWQSVCWSPELGLFAAIASSGTNRVMTSRDGITWIAGAISSTQEFQDICWSPELMIFVGVAWDLGSINQVITSSYILQATTTRVGTVELASNGEAIPNVVVQGNDYRLSGVATISGNLISTGQNLWNRDVSLSGDLIITGRNLWNRDISLSGDLQTTGNTLNLKISALSGQGYSKSIYLESPTSGDNSICMFKTERTYYPTRIIHVADGSSPLVGWRLLCSTNRASTTGFQIASGLCNDTNTGILISSFTGNISGNSFLIYKTDFTGGNVYNFSLTLNYY